MLDTQVKPFVLFAFWVWRLSPSSSRQHYEMDSKTTNFLASRRPLPCVRSCAYSEKLSTRIVGLGLVVESELARPKLNPEFSNIDVAKMRTEARKSFDRPPEKKSWLRKTWREWTLEWRVIVRFKTMGDKSCYCCLYKRIEERFD